MSSSAAAAAAASVDLTQNHNVEIISIVSVFSALSTLTLGTRLWAKAVSRRGLGADDIVLVFAWVIRLWLYTSNTTDPMRRLASWVRAA